MNIQNLSNPYVVGVVLLFLITLIVISTVIKANKKRQEIAFEKLRQNFTINNCVYRVEIESYRNHPGIYKNIKTLYEWGVARGMDVKEDFCDPQYWIDAVPQMERPQIRKLSQILSMPVEDIEHQKHLEQEEKKRQIIEGKKKKCLDSMLKIVRKNPNLDYMLSKS